MPPTLDRQRRLAQIRARALALLPPPDPDTVADDDASDAFDPDELRAGPQTGLRPADPRSRW